VSAATVRSLAEHDRLSREFKIEVELLFDANVVANWAIGESNRFRAAAAQMPPGSRGRPRLMMAALCRLEEAEEALRAAEGAARRMGPLLDALIGSEAKFEREIERVLSLERAGDIEPWSAEPGRLDS
jgi:hypothetical protein